MLFLVCLSSRGEEKGTGNSLRQDKCPDLKRKVMKVQGLLSLAEVVDQERHFSNT